MGTVRDIDRERKQLFDILHDADIAKKVHLRFRRDLDHDVDVASRLAIAPGARAEQSGMADALRLEGRLVFPQAGKDVLLFHGESIACPAAKGNGAQAFGLPHQLSPQLLHQRHNRLRRNLQPRLPGR